MKKIILFSGMILLVMNLLFGAVLSIYESFNITISSGVIAINTVVLYLTNCIQLKDGFKIPLSLLFSLLGIVGYLFSLFASRLFENNWYLLLTILLLGFEAIVLFITYVVSNKIN
mgnify:CR=1 FL=1|jgi:hypothetical protein